MSKVRGFEVALTTEKMTADGKATEVGVPQYEDVILPKRETAKSAGYDFRAAEDVVIPSIWSGVAQILMHEANGIVKNWIQEFIKGKKGTEEQVEKIKKENVKAFQPSFIHTGIKAYMQDDEVLEIYVRSSTPKKFGLILANSVGIIDADYYNNPDNDGEIMLMVYNLFPFSVKIKKGERVGQGIFKKFYRADNDVVTGTRLGGNGSTDNN